MPVNEIIFSLCTIGLALTQIADACGLCIPKKIETTQDPKKSNTIPATVIPIVITQPNKTCLDTKQLACSGYSIC